MCQPTPELLTVVACPTIKANARLRRSRRWKDQSENISPDNSTADAAPATPIKGRGVNKNGRRTRRPAKKMQQQPDSDCCDASMGTASTSPESDDSLLGNDCSPSKSNSKSKLKKNARRNRTNSNNSGNSNNSNNNSSPTTPARRKRSKKSRASNQQRPKTINIVPDLSDDEKARYLALDAEMVGIGPGGHTSCLARVSLVDWDGEVVYDVHVRVEEFVTDYRTFVSGITAEDLESENAVGFDEARSKVEELIRDRIVVGHGLKNDFRALSLSHPWHLVRDTAKYEPFMRTVDALDATPLYPAGTLVPKKLKVLAKDKLNMAIQEEGRPHSPVEDAVAALELFKKHRGKWERAVAYKVERTREIVGSGTRRERSDSLSSLSS